MKKYSWRLAVYGLLFAGIVFAFLHQSQGKLATGCYPILGLICVFAALVMAIIAWFAAILSRGSPEEPQ